MADPRILSANRFQDSIAMGVALVDFNAPWCKPCRVQESIIRAIRKQGHRAATITILNIDENRDIALDLGILSIPTIIIYKNGREIRRFIGLQTAETIESALRDAIDQ